MLAVDKNYIGVTYVKSYFIAIHQFPKSSRKSLVMSSWEKRGGAEELLWIRLQQQGNHQWMVMGMGQDRKN